MQIIDAIHILYEIKNILLLLFIITTIAYIQNVRCWLVGNVSRDKIQFRGQISIV